MSKKKQVKEKAWNNMVYMDDKKKKTLSPVNDAFTNPWARLGFGQDNLLNGTEYPLTRLSLDMQLMNSLYRDNWIVQNIINIIPNDVIKNWLKLKIDADPKDLARFDKLVRTTELKQKLIDGMKWGRLYGGAIGLIITNDMDDLEQPLNLKKLKKNCFKGLYIIDRWTGVEPSTELIDDIKSSKNGQPMYYNITGGNGKTLGKIHHSRIVKFIGRKLPYYEEVANQYWGASEIESLYRELIKRDNISENIAGLTFKANLSVYEIENLDAMLSTVGSKAQQRFFKTLEAQTMLENNAGVKVINKGDAINQQQYNFSGLPEVYDITMMDVSGATHIPVTKLFGRSPAGMNSTGESDLQNYYDFLEQTREEQLTPIIDKLMPILAISVFGQIPEDLDYAWNDVRTISDEQKSNMSSTEANTIISAYQSGIITQKQAMKELASLSEKYNIFFSIDKDAIDRAEDKTMNELQQMQDPLANLSMSEEEENENEELDQPQEEGQETPSEELAPEEIKDTKKKGIKDILSGFIG